MDQTIEDITNTRRREIAREIYAPAFSEFIDVYNQFINIMQEYSQIPPKDSESQEFLERCKALREQITATYENITIDDYLDNTSLFLQDKLTLNALTKSLETEIKNFKYGKLTTFEKFKVLFDKNNVTGWKKTNGSLEFES